MQYDNKILLAIFLTLFLKSSLLSEKKAPLFFVFSTKDAVYIFLGNIPDETEGFNLYRKTKEDEKFVKLNTDTITPIKDHLEFRSFVAEDYNLIRKATKAETDFQAYRRLLRDKGMQFALSLASLRIAEALGRLYIDKDIKFGKEYVYKVALVNYKNEEFKADQKSCVVSETKKPTPPFNIKAIPDDSQIKIEWDYYEIQKEFGYTAVGFNIYRRAEDEQSFRKINDVLILWQEGHTYRTDYEVENGKKYTYYVTAVNLIGLESEPSGYVTAVPVDKTPPAIPVGISATPFEDKILIVWKMNLEIDLSHYNLYRGMSLLDEFKQINKQPIPADLPYFEDKEIKSGIAYFYKVEAVDKAGNKSKLSSAVSAVVEDRISPEAPIEIKAKVVKRNVLLSWQKKHQEQDLAGFYVYRGKNKNDYMKIVKEPIKDKTFEDKGHQNRGLMPGVTYFYAISAVDSFYNESEKVGIEVFIPDDEPPAPPVSIYASSTEDGKVEVRWQASHSWDVAGYKIYRGEKKEVILLTEADSSTFSFVDDKVECGKRYYYYVTALDKFQNESQPTEKFYITPTDISVPPKPLNIKAKYIEKIGVKLQWDEVKIGDLAGYKVWVSEIPSGDYKLLTLTPIKKTEFIDKKGKKNLYYKVSTIDTSGNESSKSEPVRVE